MVIREQRTFRDYQDYDRRTIDKKVNNGKIHLGAIRYQLQTTYNASNLLHDETAHHLRGLTIAPIEVQSNSEMTINDYTGESARTLSIKDSARGDLVNNVQDISISLSGFGNAPLP